MTETAAPAATLHEALARVIEAHRAAAATYDHGKTENDGWRDEADDELRETHQEVVTILSGLLASFPEHRCRFCGRALVPDPSNPSRVTVACWVQAAGRAEAGGAWDYCAESPARDVDLRQHQPADSLEARAAVAWDTEQAENPDGPGTYWTSAVAADGTSLDVIVGRTCGRDFMAGTICTRWVDADGHHDGPCG